MRKSHCKCARANASTLEPLQVNTEYFMVRLSQFPFKSSNGAH